MSKEGPKSFRIRPATVTDSAGIARLAGELGYPATAAEMASRLTAMLPLPNHFVAVAESSNGLLGWAAVERRLLLISGDKAELTGLVVGSSARRTGIGKLLVAAAERWVVAQGLDTIVVRSNVARAESHPFYERLGYTRTKTQHAYVKMLLATSSASE
ncbi:MAG: GNAT family N-acetyltransferase [Gammaproteobacteria bacterium]